MRSIQTAWIWTMAISGASAVGIACSSDETGAETTNAPDASPPDGAVVEEAAAPDAGGDADARAPFDPNDERVLCEAEPCAVDLIAGDTHFCALMRDGTVRCWGRATFGVLGEGSGGDVDGGADAGFSVGKVHGLEGVTQISASGATTCARSEEAGVVCWGKNDHGQLGLSLDPPIADLDPHPDPAPVALPRGVTAARVDVGPKTGCVTTHTGNLVCWGSNEQAQLARPSAKDDPAYGAGASELGGLLVARALPTTHTTLIVSPSAEVWSWGALAGDYGPLSGRIASVSPEAIPRRVETLGSVTSVAASAWLEDLESGEPSPPRAHACAIAAGELYCWGQTYRAALCTGLPDSSRVPAHTRNESAAWPQQVAVSDELTCVRMTDGSIRCCGEDRRGRLGRGSVGLFESVLRAASAFDGHAVKVAASNGAVCVLVQGGTVACWGDNENGELGQGTIDRLDHPSPVGVRL